MFYPGVFVQRDSWLYRMYVHSCMKRVNTAVPVTALTKCLEVMNRENLSLRLQSRLMLSIVSSLLIHYRQALSAIIKTISGKHIFDRRVGDKVSDNITYKYNSDILCDIISKKCDEVYDEVEYPRGSSGISMERVSVNSAALPDSNSICIAEHLVKRVKIDKTIDLSRDTIQKEDIVAEKWYAKLIENLLPEGMVETADISSIEAARRYSTDRSVGEIEVLERSSFIPDPLNELQCTAANSRIVDFIQILYDVTEGTAIALQAVPYGRIIRI